MEYTALLGWTKMLVFCASANAGKSVTAEPPAQCLVALASRQRYASFGNAGGGGEAGCS